jgi:pilus assembly protein CpaE
MAIKQAKIITITSVKGGTGKTTTTLNLAGTLEKKKLKTVIVDMDLHAGVVAASLNLKFDQDIYSLANDFMNHKYKQIEDYVQKYSDYIDVLPAPKDPRNVGKISSKYITIILDRLKFKYDVILVDTNHIVDNFNLMSFDKSDEVIYVLTSDLMCLKNMKTMLSIYKDMNLNNYKLILNDSLNKELTPYEIKSILGTNVDYIIPKSFYIKNMQKYIMDGEIPVLKSYSKSIGALVFNKIIDDIL